MAKRASKLVSMADVKNIVKVALGVLAAGAVLWYGRDIELLKNIRRGFDG